MAGEIEKERGRKGSQGERIGKGVTGRENPAQRLEPVTQVVK